MPSKPIAADDIERAVAAARSASVSPPTAPVDGEPPTATQLPVIEFLVQPEEVPDLGAVPGPVYDQAAQDARDAAMKMEAIDNVLTPVERLQYDLKLLQDTVDLHTQQIAMLDAAIKTLPCPNGKMIPDDTVKEGERLATTSECMAAGGCDCSLGFALSMPPPATTPDYEEPTAPG